ncbi:sigma-54 interaction domain-containing protein [Aliikangiella sp. IMCC44632]
MVSPSMLLHIVDSSLNEQLRTTECITQFEIVNTESNSWIETCVKSACDIAIVQVDGFSKQDYDALIESKILSEIDVIFISNGEPNEAIDNAMLRGVTYHLRLPIDFKVLKELLDELYQEVSQHKASSSKAIKSELDQFGLLVGSSAVMRRLYRVIRKAADSNTNVFIVGESGAGKELVAHTIHLASSRSEKPFIAINCGALSPELIESELFGHVKGSFTGANKDRSGVFEQADGGTLFLDEVTEMPIEHQVKLLRVLESNEYRPVGSEKVKLANVRVIAATNREASEAIKNELFREDLYFRLAHFPIRVPLLRDRGSDILGLANHFLAYRNAEEDSAKGFTANAISKISEYDWPGNVRELKHAIERAFILAEDMIDSEHLILEDELRGESQSVTQTVPSGIPLEEIERRAIEKTLQDNEGNKSETAEQLGISVKTLYNKLEKYDKAE